MKLEGAFAASVRRMMGDGYSAYPCPAACPDRGNGQHAHMTSPDGYDFIAYADGGTGPFDLTRNSGAAYPVPQTERYTVNSVATSLPPCA